MQPQECVKILLDSSCSIDVKYERLSEYISWHEALGRNMRIGARLGRETAILELFKALPKKDRSAAQNLRNVLDEIVMYQKKLKEEYGAEAKDKAEKLRSLSPGTAIVIRRESKEDTVRFIELKRTRLICEYPDGRQYSVPTQLFIREHKGKAPKRLTEKESQQRELIRTLSGRQFKQTTEYILENSHEFLPILLDELESAIERVDDAPVGFSSGTLRHTMGLVKKVNPKDEALIKRIPLAVAGIAEKIGKGKVLKQIKKHSSTKVQNYCIKALS